MAGPNEKGPSDSLDEAMRREAAEAGIKNKTHEELTQEKSRIQQWRENRAAKLEARAMSKTESKDEARADRLSADEQAALEMTGIDAGERPLTLAERMKANRDARVAAREEKREARRWARGERVKDKDNRYTPEDETLVSDLDKKKMEWADEADTKAGGKWQRIAIGDGVDVGDEPKVNPEGYTDDIQEKIDEQNRKAYAGRGMDASTGGGINYIAQGTGETPSVEEIAIERAVAKARAEGKGEQFDESKFLVASIKSKKPTEYGPYILNPDFPHEARKAAIIELAGTGGKVADAILDGLLEEPAAPDDVAPLIAEARGVDMPANPVAQAEAPKPEPVAQAEKPKSTEGFSKATLDAFGPDGPEKRVAKADKKKPEDLGKKAEEAKASLEADMTAEPDKVNRGAAREYTPQELADNAAKIKADEAEKASKKKAREEANPTSKTDDPLGGL